MGIIYKTGICYSAPGGGDGSGNVDDVYVNGTSVLDEDKIAQIKSYKEVTQAEYDVLPDTKLSDGILYCITDQATADTTVAPIIYSEEEREVGVWRNGKPLYQKTLSLTSPSSTNDAVIADLTSLSIDNLVLITGILYSTNVNQYIPILWSYNSSTMGSVYYQFNNNELHQYISSSGYLNCQEWITIQYTKTTDQPGSGKWAPNGVPAVHYSENEQVIGTWIDGSPLYQRVLSYDTLTSAASGWTLLESNYDLSILVSYNVMGLYDSNRQLGGSYFVISYYNNNLYYHTPNLGASTSDVKVTIQYTKTSS